MKIKIKGTIAGYAIQMDADVPFQEMIVGFLKQEPVLHYLKQIGHLVNDEHRDEFFRLIAALEKA